MRKRWYIVLVATIVLSCGGLPAIWFLVEPDYVVQGTVKVRPVVPGVLTSEPSPSRIGDYGEFVNTQAVMLMSNSAVLQKIADDLAGRNLSFFSGSLRRRIEKLLARVWPMRRTARSGADPPRGDRRQDDHRGPPCRARN